MQTSRAEHKLGVLEMIRKASVARARQTRWGEMIARGQTRMGPGEDIKSYSKKQRDPDPA